MSNNEKIKKRARSEQIPLWKIAQEIGVAEMTICRWLRVELSPEREKEINEAIDKIIERRSATCEE